MKPNCFVGRAVSKMLKGTGCANSGEATKSNTNHNSLASLVARSDWKLLKEVLEDSRGMRRRRSLLRKEACRDCVLHDAIKLRACEHVLLLIVELFPETLSKSNDQGQYPLHIACATGLSPHFISHCIELCPKSAKAVDNHGKAPVHFLCQSYTRNCSRFLAQNTVDRNMTDILWMLYEEMPSSIVSDDHEGVGPIEYALESDAGIEFIQTLQNMSADFNETKRKTSIHHLEVRCTVMASRHSSRVAPSP